MSLSISLNPGDSLYKYQLTRKIGGGHFGEVWLAHDFAISQDVAIKILDESMAPVAENLKEAQVGHRLEHQNVVHVHYADVVQVNGVNVVIIAMDFHPSGSVISQLDPSNFLPISQAIRVVIDILRGLEYLHEQTLYHNDIKPSNILLGPRGEGVLTDYGISCLSIDLQPTPAPNTYILHRAPETGVHNNISVQTDIYQVGLTLFRLINGVGLVRDLRDSVGQGRFELLKTQDKVPRTQDYLPFVPTSLKRIITKATKSDPDRRYQSALEMRRALEGIVLHGYWTTDSNGSYVGHFNNQTFRFVCQKNRRGYAFIPYRKRLTSGTENKIGKLSASGLSQNDYKKAVERFMLLVVNGEV